MKIKPEHLMRLRVALFPLDTPALRAKYAKGEFTRADKTKDVNKRYRWDLLWRSDLRIAGDFDLYAYMNDDHIDSALRAIIPDVVGQFADIRRPPVPANDAVIHDPWGLSNLG